MKVRATMRKVSAGAAHNRLFVTNDGMQRDDSPVGFGQTGRRGKNDDEVRGSRKEMDGSH